jgi:teichuronic acid biosynthesis glycosyltransferase TuaC
MPTLTRPRPDVAVSAVRGWDDLIRHQRLPADGSAQREVLYVTNMWPDEVRPYYGSFIASQARSLPAAGTAVDLVYVRGFLGSQAYLKALVDLPRAGRRRPYDLIHVHYGHTIAAGIGITRRPLVMSYCGEDLLGAPRGDGFTTKSRIEVAVFRQMARLATLTITKSLEMEQALPASLQGRNRILPNGVELDRFAPRPRAEARRELGWPIEGKVILFLGNPDDPRKNVGLARAAADLVRAERSDVRLEVAWGVSWDRVPVLMNAADCLVFPSHSEGSPNAIKEAMASALPIVSTPVGDVSERLDGVENCWVREPDQDAFSTALKIAVDAGEAPQARAAVEALGTDHVSARLNEIYDEAIGLAGG